MFRYYAAITWVFATMTFSEQEKVVIASSNERIMAVVCLLVGISIYACAIGISIAVYDALFWSNSRPKTVQQTIDEYLLERKVYLWFLSM